MDEVVLSRDLGLGFSVTVWNSDPGAPFRGLVWQVFLAGGENDFTHRIVCGDVPEGASPEEAVECAERTLRSHLRIHAGELVRR